MSEITKISTTTVFKEWMNTINTMITVVSDKLDATANAVSASKLYTARKINGTSFDGTSDISTTYWGATRTISISDNSGSNVTNGISVDGSSNITLKLPPTISADIVGTSNKALQDGDGNTISSTYLKLSGGTMNGTIKTSSDSPLIGNETTKRRHICSGGSYNQGAYLALDGMDVDESTSNYIKGQFILGAHNGTNQCILNGKPNGTLTWNNKNVALSGDYLPISGGTLTGGLTVNTSLSVNGYINPFVVGVEDSTYEGGSITLAGSGDYSSTICNIDRYANKIRFHDGSTERFTCDITNGNAYFSGTITGTAVYNAVWNDYAEFFPRGEETEAGDVIALDIESEEEKYIKATRDSRLVVGVHSNTFGHLIGGEIPPKDEDFVKYNLPKYIPVGLAGRVNVKFKGISKKGFPVGLSEIPGVAELHREGCIIGYVVEDTTPSSEEERLVKILICH